MKSRLSPLFFRGWQGTGKYPQCGLEYNRAPLGLNWDWERWDVLQNLSDAELRIAEMNHGKTGCPSPSSG